KRDPGDGEGAVGPHGHVRLGLVVHVAGHDDDGAELPLQGAKALGKDVVVARAGLLGPDDDAGAVGRAGRRRSGFIAAGVGDDKRRADGGDGAVVENLQFRAVRPWLGPGAGWLEPEHVDLLRAPGGPGLTASPSEGDNAGSLSRAGTVFSPQ